MTTARQFPIFAVVFAIVYAGVYLIAVERNYALFTYHPAIEEFGFLVEPPREGPAMYWYGWIATAAIVALVAGLIACVVPEQMAKRLWSGWSWAIPVAAMFAFGYLLRGFFMR